MDFSKYAKEEFEKRGLNSDASRHLAKELISDLKVELLRSMAARVEEIALNLNREGHDLRDFTVPGRGFIAYADQQGDDPHTCHLRFEVNCVVSAGYNHLNFI